MYWVSFNINIVNLYLTGPGGGVKSGNDADGQEKLEREGRMEGEGGREQKAIDVCGKNQEGR